MAVDPRLALAGVMPAFSLDPFERSRARALEYRRGMAAYEEQMRQQAEAAAVEKAYAQQYGGGAPMHGAASQAPAGLAGVAPMAPPGQGTPLSERQLGGGPTRMAPYATAPPGEPQPPEGLAGLAPQMGTLAGGGAPRGQGQQAFVDQLYRLSPTAGREAERHALETEKAQFASHLSRVEYLGRIASGVLEADTQAAYDVGRQMLLEAGMPESQMPPVYDRQLMQMYASTALDAKDRLGAKAKAIDQQLAASRLRLDLRTEGRLERAALRAETTATRQEREAGQQVPAYTGDSTLNAEIDALMQRAGHPRGTQPPGAILEQALQQVQAGKTTVAAQAGAEAARITREDKPLEGEAAKAVSELTALQQMTDDVTDLFDPAYTGQLEGRWGAVKAWAGTAGSRETVFRRVIADMKDQLLRARSGAAITPQEYDRLSTLVPNVTDADTTFQAKLLGFRRGLDQAKQARLETATTGRGPLRRQQEKVTPLPTGAAAPPGGGGAQRTTRALVQAKLKPGWTLEQAVEYYRSQGYEVAD